MGNMVSRRALDHFCVEAIPQPPADWKVNHQIDSIGLLLEHLLAPDLGQETHAVRTAVGEDGLHCGDPTSIAVSVDCAHLGATPGNGPAILWSGGRIEQRTIEK